MILTCPDCATRFKIADNAIGSNGRTVRCSQCSTTWFVAAEPDALSLEDAHESRELREEIIREPVSDIATEQAYANEDLSGDISNSVDDGVEDKLDDVVPAIGAHASIRENADRKRARRRLFGVGMIWLVPLLILVLFALAAYFFRAKLVEMYPGVAPVYRAFGIEANSSGLEIYELKTNLETNEGVQAMLVNGKIKNFDVRTRDVQMIRLSFKNATGEVIDSWIVEPKKAVLKAGEVLAFSSQFPNPPIEAVKLAPSFVTEMSSGG